MSGVKVLDFVARELEGRILTVSSVSAFVAAEKAADKLDMTSISREAAELAVLLPKAPLERIRDEFGPATADIVEALRSRGPYSRIAVEAMALHGRSEGDGVRRDAAVAAIAACAAEAAVASEEDCKLMVNSVDIMTGVETGAARRAFLKKLRARLQAPERTDAEVERRDRTRLISISMDVSGSTAVKERMKKRARDEQELTRWYEAFHSEFLWLEWRFIARCSKPLPAMSGWTGSMPSSSRGSAMRSGCCTRSARMTSGSWDPC